MIMMAGMGVAYYIFAPFLIRFFGADTEIMDVASSGRESFEAVVVIGTDYMRIVVFSYVFIALSVALSHGLNGAGSTRTPMFIDGVGLLLIQLPMAYFLSRKTDLGLHGVWYSIVVSNAIIAVVYVILFRMGRWKRKVLW